ncbi:podocalyxin isoform 4-T4 [Alca torda]
MRAPLLLPLLLLGVSSQDVATTTPAKPEQNKQITTAGTSKTQGTTTTSTPGNTTPTPKMSPTGKPGNPSPALAISPTPVQGTTATSSPGTPPSTPATSTTTVQGATTTKNLAIPTLAPKILPHPSQNVSSSISSGASKATPAATSGAAQQKTSAPASSGSSATTTAASHVPTHGSSPPAITQSSGTAVASSPSVATQGSQPLDQLTSTAASTGVSTSSLAPGLKDNGVSSPTSVTKQPHSSPSSPGQGLTSSTRPGSIDTSVTPFDGSVAPTTSKASVSLPPGSINKVSEATTPTLGADQSHEVASASTKPTSTDQSPASTLPSAPAPGDQTASINPGHQHPNASFRNEVICKEQVQNNQPMMYLKEAKSCAEWRTASINISFFESFCSTGQHAFNASRETCTVTLSSPEPHSQRWAVQAVVHREYDPTILPRGGWDGVGIGDPVTGMQPEAWQSPWGLLELGQGALFLGLPHLKRLGRGKTTPETSFAPQRMHQIPLPSLTCQGFRRKNSSHVVKKQCLPQRTTEGSFLPTSEPSCCFSCKVLGGWSRRTTLAQGGGRTEPCPPPLCHQGWVGGSSFQHLTMSRATHPWGLIWHHSCMP